MVKLSEFIGELVSDISDARRIADTNSAELSQSYHADPFLKGMPVPHYTIQEAEIKVPVSVNRVVSYKQNNDFLVTLILSTVKLKLPQLLTNKLMENYIKKREKEQYEKKLQAAADAVTDMQLNDVNMTFENLDDKTKDDLRLLYANKSNDITDMLAVDMRDFLNSANFDVIKLLDIRDKLIDMLTRIMADKLADIDDEKKPVSEEALPALVAEIGTEMFFEFAQKSESNKGIFVDPGTGKLNEYFAKDNLMFLSLKVKEQDLDIIIENDGSAGTQRFLSLN
ncbi:MAG: hypothetical protein K2G04_07315 [Oscillospiraceae bacterium]|nr:hypothetical protein [Oscillospiraceae bacterium]